MAPKQQDLSESDLQRLRDLADEQSHERWLAERRRKRWESIKTWSVWVLALLGGVRMLWEWLAHIVKELRP